MPPDGRRRIADAIVVAAGSSSRMRGNDKLVASIGGRVVLDWAVSAFASAGSVDRIVLVAAPGNVQAVRAAPWLPDRVTAIVEGGTRRQESVAAGFRELERLGIDDARIVLVHDGARPAIDVAFVNAVARAAERHQAVVPVKRILETVKRLDGEVVAATVDRASLVTAETPQGVRADLLRRAYARFPPDGPATFTDEAALLEACSIPVHAIPGQVGDTNVKITTPLDLWRAAALMETATTRIGFGHDRHPFGPGEPLVLGGVTFAGAPRLHGHSDGDVVLHAVADALLGATGRGDLGRLFPADARTPRGADSGTLLSEVVHQLNASGQRPSFVDVTIVGARPRLGDRIEEIRARIAELLRSPPHEVSVKASTGNLDGMEGAGRGMSADVIAQVVDRS